MSTSLLPGIGEMDPNSLSYAIYTQLYQHFFNAQDTGTVIEGDVTSIRLRNTAYGFAEAIAGGVAGEGGAMDGGVLAYYLKRSGGQMSGPLGADYGFSAGIDNRRVLEVFRIPVPVQRQTTSYDYGVRIMGDLRIEGNHLCFSDHKVITYVGALDTLFVRHPKMDFSSSSIHSCGELYFGEDKTRGVYLSASALRFAGHDVYHGGNAGHAAADWEMKDATVAGELNVNGSATLKGPFTALRGVSLGYEDNLLLSIAGNMVALSADLDMRGGRAIRFGDHAALSLRGTNLQISSPGGDLLLGAEPTPRIRLMSPFSDEQGTRTLITPTGGAWFPDSLRAAHSYGGDLLSTYRTDNSDQGIIVHERLRFGGQADAYIQGFSGQWSFCSQSDHSSEPDGKMQEVVTFMGHIPSTSLLAPQNRSSDTFAIVSEADFILLGNRAEAETSIGIAGTLTRLEQQCLFFTDAHRLHSVAGGVKLYGQALFADGISSEFFSSGLSGSGWAVLTNRTTGHAEATFDTLTVRRRLRVYEMEVQHSRTSNGSLWISDACSGDSVEKL